jgi:GT2 family glycosyltransferase
MARVNIIIRAFNRLEYTSLTIREIDRLAGYDNYKMIVVDNNSTDGTGLWLKSLVKEGYYKIKPIYLTENVGDFGGTKIGYQNLDDDCEYVMQWDNDCPPVRENFLKATVEVMDAFPNIGQLMLKRLGVSHVIHTTNQQVYNGVIFGDAEIVTCVNMHRRNAVEAINFWVTDESVYWDFELNKRMRKAGYQLKKIVNFEVVHIDSFPEKNLSLQKLKYPLYFSHKPTVIGRGKINYTDANYLA